MATSGKYALTDKESALFRPEWIAVVKNRLCGLSVANFHVFFFFVSSAKNVFRFYSDFDKMSVHNTGELSKGQFFLRSAKGGLTSLFSMVCLEQVLV